MTAGVQPTFDELMGTLGTLATKLAGHEGTAIREHLRQLAAVLTTQGSVPPASDIVLRTRAAAVLEHLIASVVPLGALAPLRSLRGVNLGELVDGLHSFIGLLRAPPGQRQVQVEQLIADLQASRVLRPVPIQGIEIDDAAEALAVESARRHGLEGAGLRRAVGRMKREMLTLVRQLELRARAETQRAQTASEMERLLDTLLGGGGALGKVLVPERAALVQAFRTVDLAHMAAGLRVLGRWFSTPAGDPDPHIAALRAQFTEAVGPPTVGDPARSETERRADFDRYIRGAVDEIFRATNPAS
ncbi:MAG TPA: hypothetical protein VLM79_02775 [Kofleriaceae bacterium]|nr:hypothetical protein [Kofleriaceae bacterium]